MFNKQLTTGLKGESEFFVNKRALKTYLALLPSTPSNLHSGYKNLHNYCFIAFLFKFQIHYEHYRRVSRISSFDSLRRNLKLLEKTIDKIK